MRPARLLLVEDEADVLLINKEYFEQQGYEVACAATLAQARAVLADMSPDLILLDLMLPDGSGHELCAEVRQVTTAPILYLSSCSQEDSVLQGFGLGADDYILKPYDIQVLGARVAAHLRRAGLLSSGRVELPPLMVDLMAGRAVLEGRDVELSQKELQLLAFFAASAGRRFTADELYERVWGAPALDSSQTVKVHISHLRKKLGMDGDDCPFEIRVTKDKEYMFNKIRY